MPARSTACVSQAAPEDLFGFRSPFSYLGLGLSEEVPITDLPSIRVVLLPPGLYLGVSRRSGEHELLPGVLGLLLSHPEVVVVEDAQRLDDVRDRDRWSRMRSRFSPFSVSPVEGKL
jgi:hypothetical protein